MELYTGRTQKVYLDVYVSDELRDTDSLPQVNIYDLNTDVLIVAGTAAKESDDEGHYSFVVRDDFVMTDKMIKVVWTYSVDFNQMTTVDAYHVVTPYLSIHDVYTKLHFGREPGDANYVSYHEVREAEKFARFMIENFTGVNFGKQEKTVSAYGQDADVLFLGERIISYSVIKENNKLAIDTVNSINNFNFAVNITETNHALRIYSEEDINEGGMKDIVYPHYGSFVQGYKYDITGVFGWKSVPEKVQTGALMLVRDYFSKDHIWRSRFVQSVSYGDTDMEFSKLAFRGTGNFYVDKLLEEYKSTNMAVI